MKADNDNVPSWVVYTLADSRTPDDVRYVGITCNPKGRLAAHINGDARPNHRTNWIKSVLNADAIVNMDIQFDGLGCEEAKSKEIELIADYRFRGYRLVNSTDGGDGLFNPTPEVRAKIRAAKMGRVLSAETRAKIGDASRGRVPTEDTKAKLSASLSGVKKSPEHAARVGLAQQGKVISAESRAKMSEAAKNRSEKTRENMAAAQRGKRHSDDHCRKISEALKGRVFSEDTLARLSFVNGSKPPLRGKYKGIAPVKARWQARIAIDGKRILLGYYDMQEDAARAYDKAAFERYGLDCYLNFPDEFATQEATA